MDKSEKYTQLIKELTNLKEEGNILYSQNKKEEAKLKYKQAYEKFESEFSSKEKQSLLDEKNNEIILLLEKILSNLALCYYTQEQYKEAIEIDKKLLEINPNFSKSLVRLFNSFIKLKDRRQAVYYGELFLQLEQGKKNKFKGIEEKIKEAKLKLGETGIFSKLVLPSIVLLLAILSFLIWKKYN